MAPPEINEKVAALKEKLIEMSNIAKKIILS
jgi:hypothetical protein